jgi:hypothetical protein
MLHRAIGPEYAAMTRAVKALVTLQVTHRASKMSADGAGHCKPLISVAKHIDLLVREKRGSAEGKVRRITDL